LDDFDFSGATPSKNRSFSEMREGGEFAVLGDIK
jgi:hypothetical protein